MIFPRETIFKSHESTDSRVTQQPTIVQDIDGNPWSKTTTSQYFLSKWKLSLSRVDRINLKLRLKFHNVNLSQPEVQTSQYFVGRFWFWKL